MRSLRCLPWMMLAAASLAEAQPDAGWRELVEPERRLGITYRQDGLAHLLRAMGPETEVDAALGGSPRWVLLEQALLRFERARRIMPDDPELAFYRAYTLGSYRRAGPDGSTEERVDEAIEAWRHLRALAPSFLPHRVAWELAMLHMRRHEFAQARAEYEAALRHAIPRTVELLDQHFLAAPSERRLANLFGPLDPGNVHGNLAEAAMLVGDVASAIHHYRAAMDSADDPITRSLAQWGLALALERSGSHDEALRTAARALREDPVSAIPAFTHLSRTHGPFAVLYLDFVFFEPPYELHAYEALGREALARPDGAALDREELRRAAQRWRRFLAEGGNASRYASIARQRLAQIEQELDPPPSALNPRAARSPRR